MEINRLANIFGVVDNLESFIHPYFNTSFYFMHPKELTTLASQLVEIIKSSGRNQIIVLETGAVPLAKICEKIADKRGYNLNWFYLKLPRQLEECLAVTLLQWRDSSLSSIAQEKVILFDEYVDSGMTIKNSIHFFQRILKNEKEFDCLVVCYFSKHKTICNKEIISLYNPQTELTCYQRGVYPFENRLDLIGYFYRITENKYQKNFIRDLIINQNPDYTQVNFFIDNLCSLLKNSTLLETIKETCQIDDVADYISINNLYHYALVLFEKRSNAFYSHDLFEEFYFQLFEMYAPIWSPLPDEYHLDFMASFKKNDKAFNDILFEQDLSKNNLLNYVKIRESIVSIVAQLCEERQKKFEKGVLEYVVAQ